MSDVACPDDAFLLRLVTGQLRGPALDEADAHLDGCDSCREAVIELARTGDAPTAALRRGATVGRYVVLGVAGRGGMGVVHAAYDTELERKVALKLLGAAHGDEPQRARARLVREAQAMARLAHPNVVGVYEVGTLGDELYLAMEYVDGLTLREWLLARPRRWQEIRDGFVQAGRGLAAAHAVGLVHRDFKPDNVVIGLDGRARVTDFGLARELLGDEASEERAIPIGDAAPALTTRTGALAGTPAYMAPEQLDGAAADARADQFAFCVALREALSGQRPFAGASVAALRQAIERGPAPPPAGARPAWLYRILSRGLAPDPGDRWPSMEALLAALEREGTRARPTLALVGGAAVLAAAVALWSLGRGGEVDACTGGPDRIAAIWNDGRAAAIETAFAGADQHPAGRSLGEAVTRWRDDWVAMYGGRCRATRAGEQSDALLDLQMHCLDRRLREVDALLAELERGGEVALSADRALAALPALESCQDAAALTGVEPPPARHATALAALEARIDDTRALVVTGRYAAALERARAIADDAIELGHAPTTADAWLLVAEAARGAGQADEAEAAAVDALLAAEAGRADTTVARAWIAQVGIAGERGRYQEAARLGRHAAVWVERIGAPVRLEATLRNTVGLVHYNRGAHEAAARELERALALRSRELGPEHPEVARTLTALGNLARARRDHPAALDHHRRALAIDRAVLGDAHPNVGRHLHNLAGVLRLQGELDAAAEHYARALAIEDRALGAAHPQTALTHNSLGLVELERGHLDAAREHFARAAEALVAADHGEAAVALHNLGRVAARSGDPAAALGRYRDALARYQRDLGGPHERIARVWLAIGEAHLAVGDRRAARQAYQRAAEVAAALEQPGTLADDARRGLALSAPPAPGRRPAPAAAPAPAPAPPPAEPSPPPPAGSAVYAPAQGWD